MQWLLEFLERQGAVIRGAFPSFVGVCLVAVVVLYFVFERLYKARLESLKDLNATLKERLTECENTKKETPQSSPPWLSKIVEHDRLELQTAVYVLECIVRESLTSENQHVTFDFFIRNGSVYAVTVDPVIKGFISLNSRRLTGEITTSSLPHNLQHIYGDRFQIRQELIAKDVEELAVLDSALEHQGYYDFGHLHITIHGDSPTTKAVPARLQFKRVTRRQISNGFELV